VSIAVARVLIFGAAASFLVCVAPAHTRAQDERSSAVLRVPPGARISATFGEATAEVGVAKKPQLVAMRFGRIEGNRFVAYAPTEAMPYDRAFLVQLQYAAEPTFDVTTVTLATKAGTRHQVRVYKVVSNPTVFRSSAMSFEDPSACEGLRFCAP
jgi:hypothetical protein